MKKTFLEILLNILSGASWALVFIFTIKLFFMFIGYGLTVAILAAFLGSLIGLFLVVIIEIAFMQIEKLKEIQKQTALLEIIASQTKKHDILSDN